MLPRAATSDKVEVVYVATGVLTECRNTSTHTRKILSVNRIIAVHTDSILIHNANIEDVTTKHYDSMSTKKNSQCSEY